LKLFKILQKQLALFVRITLLTW